MGGGCPGGDRRHRPVLLLRSLDQARAAAVGAGKPPVSGLQVTLPDGSQREAAAGTTPRQIAESIGPGLARAAVAARVNGEIWDLDRPLEADAQVSILTERDADALPVLRHSSAHILATAVRE